MGNFRRRESRTALMLAMVGTLALAATAVPAVAQSFSAPLVLGGLAWPTSMAFAPDGRLFISLRDGRVVVLENGSLLPTPFIDLRQEVIEYWDLGLLCIALDPDFAANRHVYLLYTVDSCGASCTNTFARLVRYTGTVASNGNQADLKSCHVLIGETAAEGFPSCTPSHTIGALRWGNDGSLFVSAGDGASFTAMDPGGQHPACFAEGLNDPIENVGAFRAQFLGSHAGKILRIDPATGFGLPSNPYWTGRGSDKASRVWAYGLRNPFRFAVRPGSPGPGTLYIGDVGWALWEEINVSTGGENFGWPCYEGFNIQASYFNANPAHSGCSSLGSPNNPGPVRPPIISWHHSNPTISTPPGFVGRCVIGGAFYQGTTWPQQYHGALIFGDYMNGWLMALRTDADNQFIDLLPLPLGAGFPFTDLVSHPTTGELYFLTWLGQLRRIEYTPKTGDLHIDGVVDVLDLLILLGAWGPCPPRGDCPADLNGNGTVDVQDLLILLSNWG
ncbi:MAG TPA: PQQ-dependent sugar dehydrogenase [Phycisphaerales bacterium]|nr:PQQ-dependent sugar dehydrogenase [Phycisphaerales bacterium]HRQ75387.1 PQQ-dependent sugar dehydrogenase [Phycisphaerales bacterium]